MEIKRVAVVGYGNIGRAVIAALPKQPDMELAAVLTRRVEQVREQAPDLPIFSLDRIDLVARANVNVAILCGGSCTDLFDGRQGPQLAERWNTVDSFDTHARIRDYAELMQTAAEKAGTVAVFSVGWDPGTFSLARVYADAFLPGCKPYAFYGLTEQGGLSMGHSDAIRQIPGVADARQYTHAKPEAMELVRSGKNPDFEPGDLHWRECIVVLEDGADEDEVRRQIVDMPNYFAPYQTTVEFVTQEELERDYSDMPHDGVVIAASETSPGNAGVIEYANTWNSNPEGTAGIMLAFARAAVRLRNQGQCGAFTPLDVPPALLSPRSREELLTKFM